MAGIDLSSFYIGYYSEIVIQIVGILQNLSDNYFISIYSWLSVIIEEGCIDSQKTDPKDR
jgi:hypothetical protein